MPKHRILLPILATLLLIPTLHAQGQTQAAKPDPHSPENAARTALIDSLNKLAAQQTAARRLEISKITTLAQAKARQQHVRATMLRLLGPLPARTPLNPQILGESKIPAVRIQKILFDSQPNFHVTALLYLPDPLPAGKLPAIIIAPGHGATGKASDFASAATFARNGFAVLSYDPIGQGERLQYPDPANPTKSLARQPTGEHAEASLQPILLGETLARYMLWDGMRAVDYLLTRPEVDPTRIGAYGCSGGGAMTALLGALDPRIAATGTACYITSFDTLLPSIGPQDGEQSTPGWLSNGLDFPDWIELAAPRPYAVISTSSDMFPYAGARASVTEARHFYRLFNAHLPINLSFRSAAEEPAFAPPPTTPTPNPDSPTPIPTTDPLQWLVGPGGHGNLRPLQPLIVSFFLQHLAHSIATPILPPPPTPGTSPFALPPDLPKDALQVTPTGQVATSYPNTATVFTLNLAHAHTLPKPKPLTLPQLQSTIRQLTGASAVSGGLDPAHTPVSEPDPAQIRHRMLLTTAAGIQVPAEFYRPTSEGKHPGHLTLRDALPADRPMDVSIQTEAASLGTAIFLLAPRPSPSGTEEQKTPLLGFYYLLGLRAEIDGKTLLGMRVDDVIRAIDFFAANPSVDPNNITASASGPEALVLLHAAILDPRLKHITLSNLPPTYAQLLATPLPKDAPENLIPGVLLHYDIPDLIRALGSRVTIVPAPAAPSETTQPSQNPSN